MGAAVKLSEEGIEVEVVDLMTLFPLDKELILASVRKTGRLVILDEARATCSAASEIAAIVAEQGFASLRGPVRRDTVQDVAIPFAPHLENAVIPDEAMVEAAIRAAVRDGDEIGRAQSELQSLMRSSYAVF